MFLVIKNVITSKMVGLRHFHPWFIDIPAKPALLLRWLRELRAALKSAWGSPERIAPTKGP
jgi:hypothetical protein